MKHVELEPEEKSLIAATRQASAPTEMQRARVGKGLEAEARGRCRAPPGGLDHAGRRREAGRGNRNRRGSHGGHRLCRGPADAQAAHGTGATRSATCRTGNGARDDPARGPDASSAARRAASDHRRSARPRSTTGGETPCRRSGRRARPIDRGQRCDQARRRHASQRASA